MALIELAQLSRHFSLGDSTVHALRELSLTIDAGEYVAVIGTSPSLQSPRLRALEPMTATLRVFELE